LGVGGWGLGRATQWNYGRSSEPAVSTYRSISPPHQCNISRNKPVYKKQYFGRWLAVHPVYNVFLCCSDVSACMHML